MYQLLKIHKDNNNQEYKYFLKMLLENLKDKVFLQDI